MNEHELIQGYNPIKLQNTKPKRNAIKDALAKDSNEKGSRSRYLISIVSFRQKLLDEDNLAGGSKFLIDCLRPHLIPDDSPEAASFAWKQIKVKTKEEEGTEIQIKEVICE